jgi:hypothetical protein
MNPLLVIKATILRHRGTYLVFVLLVAVATSIGVGITAQETALRVGSARAADKFDLVIAAPGSETDVVLAAIYLRPGTVPLLQPAVVAKAFADPHAKIAAPLGFGDSIRGSPIVGSIAGFVDYLSGGLQTAASSHPRARAWPVRRRRSRSARAFTRSMDCMRKMMMMRTNTSTTSTRTPSPSSGG